jgi:Asp-tRNA(Asn)/Glu-tRNA(Gln) amidotransferase A subunit family amidase
MAYDLVEPNMPRMAGTKLKAVVGIIDSPFGGLLTNTLMKSFGIPQLRHFDVGDSPAAPAPMLSVPAKDRPTPDLEALADLPTPKLGAFQFESVADLRAAYKAGTTDPVQVAERALTAVEDSERHDPPFRLFIDQHRDDVLEQAAASKARWDKGELLGPLDGIPIAVKDEADVAGYPTTLGTRFYGAYRGVAKADATGPGRLRAAGGVLLGKANMTEIGISPIGEQPHHGLPRNPYDPSRYTGGSSSGPAATVAYGLCPISVGADGGGSIRIPAAHCGVVGLKATFGRVSEVGIPPVCWSVAHLGPIAATARDCALGYALMAGPDPDDALTAAQPPVDLERLEDTDLTGVTLGVYAEWFDHSDPQVVRECRRMLDHLCSKGATVKEIVVDGLDGLRLAHAVTIVSEMYAAQMPFLDKHAKDYALDTRLKFGAARSWGHLDYLHAQRVRFVMCQQFERLLHDVDAIVTPTSGCTAPVILPDALEGSSDLTLMSRVMRYAHAGNFTGLPTISFPAGYDDDGLPVGFQAMGRAYDEALLLRLAVAAEDGVDRQKPAHWTSLL